MNGLYIVVLEGIIYGVYDSDEAAKRCQEYVGNQLNKMPEIRYFILNKNYWEEPTYTQYNELYTLGLQLQEKN